MKPGILLFPMLLSLLASCSPLPAAGPEPVTLTFVVIASPWLDDHRADYERLAAIYQEANPHVTIDVRWVSWDELPRELPQADFLTDPEWGVDVVMTDADLLTTLADSDLFRDLGPSLEGDQALQAEDFYPGALDALRWQGHLYSLPAEIDPWVMFYNRELFDAAGIPYPADDWRWDDFLEAARALNESPAVRFPFGSWGAEVTPFVYQNGGALTVDLSAPEELTLDQAATVEAIRWYLNLALVEGIMPTPAELADHAVGQGRGQTILSAGSEAERAALQAQADLEQAVVAGQVAMWMGPLSGRGGRAGGRWDYQWGVAPLPAGRRTATVAGLQGYFITAHSEHYTEALRWIDFLTRQLPLYRGMPVRRSVAASDAFRSSPGAQAVPEDSLLVPDSLSGRASQLLQGPLFAVLAGEQTVEEALAALQSAAE
jgi:ABC-type glycerol-3-phosphate transport system substrate-binding protein